MQGTCSICGGHGQVVSVSKITCAKGCCEALRNDCGRKTLKGKDPIKCGGPIRHAAVAICMQCKKEHTVSAPKYHYDSRPAVRYRSA
jgi:hypothetical protein